MRDRRTRLAAVAAVAVLLAPGAARSAEVEPGTVYYTVGVLEPDRLASAWLIARHVDRGASVRLLPDGEAAPPGGVPFDLPDAGWSRAATRSTFETILASADLDDPGLRRIAAWVRASEFSYWMLEPGSPEMRFDRAMKEFSERRDVEGAFRYLDRLYREARGGS